MTPKAPPPRIWVVRATRARSAAVFRRGPAQVVQVSKWSLDTDTIDYGQWLKGRIYERRCDVSPSGEYLVYFAANHRPPHGSWTAMSRLPWLTALGFWPKGDCWGGGGVFLGDDRLALNHQIVDVSKFARTFRRSLTIEPFGVRSGGGEDGPINRAVLAKGGWRSIANAKEGSGFEKESPDRLHLLWMIPRGWFDQRPRFCIAESRSGEPGRTVISSNDLDWADWDDNGDLLFATEGRLMRLRADRLTQGLGAARLVADFGLQSYDPQPSPARARRW